MSEPSSVEVIGTEAEVLDQCQTASSCGPSCCNYREFIHDDDEG